MEKQAILLRKEFNQLSDNEKISYFLKYSDWFLALIESCDPGDDGLPELFTDFCRSKYNSTVEILIDQQDDNPLNCEDDPWDCIIMETLKRNRVENSEIILFVIEELYNGDNFIYPRLRNSGRSRPPKPMPLDAEPCILFEYTPNLLTFYVGSPEIATKKKQVKLGKEYNSIVLYNILELKKLKMEADLDEINRLCLFWLDAAASREVASFEGYSELCQNIVKFFRSEIDHQGDLELSFKNSIPLEIAWTVSKDFQKKLSLLKGHGAEAESPENKTIRPSYSLPVGAYYVGDPFHVLSDKELSQFGECNDEMLFKFWGHQVISIKTGSNGSFPIYDLKISRDALDDNGNEAQAGTAVCKDALKVVTSTIAFIPLEIFGVTLEEAIEGEVGENGLIVNCEPGNDEDSDILGIELVYSFHYNKESVDSIRFLNYEVLIADQKKYAEVLPKTK